MLLLASCGGASAIANTLLCTWANETDRMEQVIQCLKEKATWLIVDAHGLEGICSWSGLDNWDSQF